MGLERCASCNRHVRADARSCPFCRTTRAAGLLATGLTALALTGCPSDTTPPAPAPQPAPPGPPAPVYGGAPMRDPQPPAPTTEPAPPAPDTTTEMDPNAMPAPAYGAPPPDAPVYGAPPPR